VATSDRDAISRQLRRSLLALACVILVGTVGYFLLGFSPLDAVYQTITTVTTIGFREVQPFGTAEKMFTILFVLVGVGVVLYTLSVLLGVLIEGWAGNEWGRRRMEKQIQQLRGHTIVCGWGRVGRAASHQLARSGHAVVVVDVDPERVADCPYPYVIGDASSEEVLLRAGVDRAATLVASLENDAASVYLVLTARALRPDLSIIARARTDDATAKLQHAGANRVVNPQRIGGDRIAAFALQPHVTEFLDVAMRDSGVEFRLEEVDVRAGSALAGRSVRETRLQEGGGALLLALRRAGAQFETNPSPEATIDPGDVVIVVGTADQVQEIRAAAGMST
jgi:voltage-gated potassium channel